MVHDRMSPTIIDKDFEYFKNLHEGEKKTIGIRGRFAADHNLKILKKYNLHPSFVLEIGIEVCAKCLEDKGIVIDPPLEK